MPQLVRCKPCGYVSREDKLGKVCPACGASLKAFEPYEDKVSPRRRFILNLDLHPILIHAPQTFAAILPLVVLVGILFPAFYASQVIAVAAFTALILPPAVLGAIFSGLVDGKVKMKKLTTPLLLRKIALGCCLLAVSSANAAIIIVGGFQPGTKLWVLFFSAASFVCAVLLGRTGKQLILPILPGRL